MSSSSGSDTTSMLLGRYHVEATLGEGSFGTVVRAFDTRLKRVVAIKTLKRSLATTDIEQFRAIEERFAREAEAGSRMGIHTNLVTVHDLVIEPDRTQYLILEFVRGGTLAEQLARGPLTLGDALRVTADVARGLQSAHDVGIVHRDVKPANIFLTPDGRAQLGDFGIAQIDDVSGRTHAVVHHPGTPLYMSPEQAQTTGYVRPASDQYSLGLVFFEMLTGTAYKRIGERAALAFLESQPAAVTNLIEDMIATNPDDRLLSCDHVVRQTQVVVRQMGLTETVLDEPLAEQGRHRVTPRPPGIQSDERAASSGAVASGSLDKIATEVSATDGARGIADGNNTARATASTSGVTVPVTAHLDASPPPPAVFGGAVATGGSDRRSRRGLATGAGIVIALLLVLGVGAAFLLNGRNAPTSVTQTPQQPAATAPPVATVAASPVIASTPTLQPTAITRPTVAPIPTAAAIAPSATLPLPTVAPTLAPTTAPPTAPPAPRLAVFSVGTTNANLDTVNGDDVVTTFTAGQDVYGWINFGGAQVNRDVLEVTLVANGTPQAPQSFTLTKSDGFKVFLLGKLSAGDYRLEVRYAGKLAQAADFHVAAVVVQRQPTAVPRPNPIYNPPNPAQPTPVPVQPTSAPAPTVAPVPTVAPTVAPKPTVSIPPTQPPPKP